MENSIENKLHGKLERVSPPAYLKTRISASIEILVEKKVSTFQLIGAGFCFIILISLSLKTVIAINNTQNNTISSSNPISEELFTSNQLYNE